MKFKYAEGQNQRLERISTSHLVVGIDMAKETHVAQALSKIRYVLKKDFEKSAGPADFSRTSLCFEIIIDPCFYKVFLPLVPVYLVEKQPVRQLHCQQVQPKDLGNERKAACTASKARFPSRIGFTRISGNEMVEATAE